MKLVFTLFVFISLQLTSLAQFPCSDSSTIQQLYKTDADRMAVRMTLNNSLPYKDSVNINSGLSDTLLGAMIAVYMADSLPARDSVVNMFNIHSRYFNVRAIDILANATKPWVTELKNGNTTTSNAAINQLITNYGMTYSSSISLSGQRTLMTLKANADYNVSALTGFIDNIYGVIKSTYRPDGAGDGNNITAVVTPANITLTYSYGWGDCPAGCIHRRYWEFKVGYDCSVTFKRSYGSKLWPTNIRETAQNKLRIYPIPFENELNVAGITGNQFSYQIHNMEGRLMLEGNAQRSIQNLDNLSSGVYFLSIKEGGLPEGIKVIKH